MLVFLFSLIYLSYRDQFAMLAEGIARERFEMEVREKAQEKVRYSHDMTVYDIQFLSCLDADH